MINGKSRPANPTNHAKSEELLKQGEEYRGDGRLLPPRPAVGEHQTESRYPVDSFTSSQLEIRKEVGASRWILPFLVAPSTLLLQSQVILRDQAWLVAVLEINS